MKIRGFVMAAALAGLSLAAEPVKETPKLEQMANAAVTAEDHARVAKGFRLRAESFEQRAAKHEAEAAKLAKRPLVGPELKWPALARPGLQKEKDAAVQARRAAAEAMALSDRHTRLAVEKAFAE
jgi:hypothetical protein